MNVQSYERVIDKDIIDIKKYLLEISESYWQQDLHDIVNKSMDIKIVRRKINGKKGLCLNIFNKIKKLIDSSTSLNEMEKHLIFMNILLKDSYRPLMVYKCKLFNYIIDNGGFSIETYCLLRHLTKFNEEVMEGVANRLNLCVERYHYLASLILLLEKKYKQVYAHLKYVSIDQEIERYLPALYNFSPRLFNNYSKNIALSLNLAII